MADFHPEMPFLLNLYVNLRDSLCGVPKYASAQSLDFLDLEQKFSFLNWKYHKLPIIGKANLWMGNG